MLCSCCDLGAFFFNAGNQEYFLTSLSLLSSQCRSLAWCFLGLALIAQCLKAFEAEGKRQLSHSGVSERVCCSCTVSFCSVSGVEKWLMQSISCLSCEPPCSLVPCVSLKPEIVTEVLYMLSKALGQMSSLSLCEYDPHTNT